MGKRLIQKISVSNTKMYKTSTSSLHNVNSRVTEGMRMNFTGFEYSKHKWVRG